jgi:hypothetical protein
MPSVLDRILGRKLKPEVLKPEEPNKVEEMMLKDLSESIKQPDPQARKHEEVDRDSDV